jgi:hypothetical protein
MIELEWEPHVGCDYAYQKAMVTSLVPDGGQMIVQFKGWSTEGKDYLGVIRIPLCTTQSLATGTCTYGGNDAPFRLIGAFQDKEYDGTWYEGIDYVATFSFDTNG